MAEAVAPSTDLGEGPHWHEPSQSLYYVDINNSTIHRYVPATKTHTSAKVVKEKNVTVSFVIPVKDERDQFVISVGGDLALVTWDGVSDIVQDFKTLLSLERTEGNRLNDGKVAPNGALITGSMGRQLSNTSFTDKRGYLYCFKDKKARTLLDKVGISNGLAWNLDGTIFYYIDSLRIEIEAFDYDPSDSTISNRRTIFSFKENAIFGGLPDGMTIDSDGNLWVAVYGLPTETTHNYEQGGQILHIDPIKKELIKKVEIPCPQVTSVAFGGAHLDDLYVTTAANGLTDQAKRAFPHSGCLFVLRAIRAKGLPAISIQL